VGEGAAGFEPSDGGLGHAGLAAQFGLAPQVGRVDEDDATSDQDQQGEVVRQF
jgi:hypothetical protein